MFFTLGSRLNGLSFRAHHHRIHIQYISKKYKINFGCMQAQRKAFSCFLYSADIVIDRYNLLFSCVWQRDCWVYRWIFFYILLLLLFFRWLRRLLIGPTALLPLYIDIYRREKKKRFFCFVLMTVIERENNQKDRSSYITLNDSSSFHFPRAAEVKVAYCPWTALSLILIDGAPHNPDHL